MNLPENFRIYLISQKSSLATVKNYLADINHFLNWLMQTTGIKYQIAGKSIFGLFTTETINEYQLNLSTAKVPSSTINRRLSALRKLGEFALLKGWLSENPAQKIANLPPLPAKGRASTQQKILENFRKYLEAENISPLTIKNYLSDLRHFLGWLAPRRTW